ncbi:hypothetical protein DEJ23_12990 [Curtobacterium sp. MCSS17_008]|uniref:SIR2 family protein n=1 Tax=Curtobacterium sp. MCSS17_008 TaxID=2175647 RepID=UPI000DAA4D12|nr:SIR2 family protein [Curtobacterium sp. MCSS17_008]PZF55052.1 hypothetical protein DEJ23_12990 [Curtobacterium sp. MCSS17_008]
MSSVGDTSSTPPLDTEMQPHVEPLTDADDERARSFAQQLADHHSALPYLFIGSGISRRYLGLPDWEGLLQVFAEEVGENFNYHLAAANGDYPTAASSIAKAFYPHWWNDSKYKEQVREYENEARTHQDGAIKAAIASYIVERQDLLQGRPGRDDPSLNAEVSLLQEVVVDGVITTNYDSLTDQLFPAFTPYVGQDELMFSDAQFIAETYKIHGSAARPSSLVLTSTDYAELTKRNHYLAAKLLTIFAEHPVLFVGYSLTDEYIGEILGNIATAVGPARLDELGSRIYIAEWNSHEDFEPLIEKASIERGGHRLPITRIETNSFAWLWSALGRLERPFPAGVLRELRKHVFDLVTHPDPDDTREIVRAIPIDAEDAAGVRVVFGVGRFSDKDLEDLSSISARTLTRADLERDVLGVRERALDAESVLKYGIPEQIRPRGTDTLPVHKYLHESGRISSTGDVDYTGLRPIIRQLAERKLQSRDQYIIGRYRRQVDGKLQSPRDVMAADFALYFKLECLLLLDPSLFDLKELRAVLVELYESSVFESHVSNFRRVLAWYDRLRSAA